MQKSYMEIAMYSFSFTGEPANPIPFLPAGITLHLASKVCVEHQTYKFGFGLLICTKGPQNQRPPF